jgi:predicted nucleic acid-binding protein
MARYVIDAPTLLHLVDAGLRVDPGHRLVAPNSIRSQALKLLLQEVRAGKRAEAAALTAHERLTEMKMRLLGDRVSRRTAWQIAREHGWDTLRDAEYLAVTRLQADALVTVDPSFAATARSIVPVAAIDHLLAPGCQVPKLCCCGGQL